MFYYTYCKEQSIFIPSPFNRVITPIFMADNSEIYNSNFSIHITEWEPNCEIDLHHHSDHLEAMCCISGNGIATIAGKEYPFVPNSMIVAPPGVTHKIKNTGRDRLRVFCVFSPPVTGEFLRNRAFDAVLQTQNK